MVHSDEMDCRKDGVFSFRVPVKPRRQLETPQLKFFNIPVSAQMPEPMVATSSDLITAPPQRTGMETEEKVSFAL